MSIMYDVPTKGCNLEIMGWPFYIEEVSANEAFRRRETNVNNIVGGTQKVTKGAYVGLDFSVVTHVKINPHTPNMFNTIFQEMMKGPVNVVSPELGGRFKAMVVIKPEHDTPKSLKLTISIKEIPDSQSKIPGENFIVPAPRKIKVAKTKKSKTTKSKTNKKTSAKQSKRNNISKKSKSK